MTTAENTVAVIGAGTMGAGIAQVALEAGWSVRMYDALPGATDHGRDRILDGLRRRSDRAGHEPAWIQERMAGLSIVGSPAAAAEEASIVIEAIVEELAAKRTLFAELDTASAHATILATNTSALSVSAIATGAALHPDRVVGLHFFNPAPVLRLVEVVAGAMEVAASGDVAIGAAVGGTPRGGVGAAPRQNTTIDRSRCGTISAKTMG